MIDWSKLGPANSPNPSTPDTTAPVAPAAPGSLAPAPTVNLMPTGGQTSYKPGDSSKAWTATQEDVNALDPGQRMARGIDILGDALFGQGNGSLLGGLPGAQQLAGVIGAGGDLAHGILTVPEKIGVEVPATVISHIPLGWVPGGADDTFNQIGSKIKDNPAYSKVYDEWLKVNAAANGDVLGGGNLKGDFNAEFMKMQDDMQHDSILGSTPDLAIGSAGVGSVGGALVTVWNSFLGLSANTVQGALGHTAAFDPYYSGGEGKTQIGHLLDAAQNPNKYAVSPGASTTLNLQTMNDFERFAVQNVQSGKWTESQAQDWIDQNINTKLDRVQEAAARLDAGMEVSPVEKQAVEAWKSGAWSRQHAGDFIVSHGQGITRNPLGQALGTVLTDPLTYATLGAGEVSKLGTFGKAIMDVSKPAEELTNIEKMAVIVGRVQNSQMGPAFRIARGLFDPLGVYKPSSVARATTDLVNGAALGGVERAFGAGTIKDGRAIMREIGQTTEADTHMASFALDKAHELAAGEKQASLLQEGFGEAMIAGQIPVDETVHLAAQNAGRDAETKMADYVQRIMKTTFTAEEMRTLPARLATVYGKDITYWTGKLKGASNDLKAWLHAVSYKGGEKDFVESVAKVDRTAYAEAGGKLPLDNMVLMNSETMDDVIAKQASADLKAELAKGANAISDATTMWNDLAHRYPAIANIGYATGGKEQLNALIKELDAQVEKGAITRRALGDELAHPALQPVRDFLDRHTMTMTAAEKVAAQKEFEAQAIRVTEQRARLAQALIDVTTPTGRAKAGMVAERDAAKAALEHFNAIHPADEFAKMSDQLPLWRIGFRPDEEVAWGISRDPVTGLPRYDRVPTISHVIDAVPGRQRFSDTTRNVLGQIIGKSAAERANAPIDSIEAFVNTLRDGVTGQRLVTNIEQRFERSTFEAGIPKPLSKEIMTRAKEVAGLNSTTLRGVSPGNIWDAIHEIVPRDLVLKDGTTLNQHIVMDHLLKAAEGDLRIMGLTSKTTQRMRNALRAAGLDPINWTGQMTVTMYNKLRYSQPMFLIQRITDAPYYSILYGIKPVGRAALTGVKAETEKLLDAIGRTGLARHFSMDMPEYATRSNFTAGIKSAMQESGLKANILDRVHSAPDAIIANNMTNMMHARLGDIVKGALDNLMTAAEKADPSIRAEMMAQAEELGKTFGEWRRIYSESAGRVLDDNEVGLRYMQDHLNAVRRAVVNADGTLDYTGLLGEADLFTTDGIGKIDSFRPDWLAKELGFADSAALRDDVVGTVKKVNGTFQLVKGEHDLPWLEEQLRDTLHAHPDKTRRIMSYYSSNWDDFWYNLSKPIDKGGLDISAHYAKEAQAVIAAAAKERGMDPWEYLSGTMGANIGIESLHDNMAKLVRFLQAGKADQPLEAWSDLFRGHLDVSAQQTLLAHFENSAEGSALNEALLAKSLTPAEWGQKALKTRPGAKPRTTGDLPANFKAEPGYVYRIDTIDRMRGGLHADSEGVALGAPDTTYIDGRPGLGVFRVKADPADLNPYSAIKGAPPVPGYGQFKSAVSPENIEMLTPDGWVSLGSDPMTKIMSKDFPDLLRQRAASGVPHPDPEVEGYMQAFTKWLKANISDAELGQRTRSDLRSIVESIPTNHATNFNRSHDLMVTLLKDKIADAQQDVFRLAEMQTKRTVIERSLNHPLFGLYPSSYMWGKVLPETIKFFARNPYAATYAIADVQRAIAVQREYDPQVEQAMHSMDRSAGMFLLDYLTPGLPWSDHEARLSPMVRDIIGGKWENIWPDELDTVSPDRWVKQVRETIKEIPGALDVVTGQDQTQNPVAQSLAGLAGSGAPGPTTPTGTPPQITGIVPAAGLQNVLADDLGRLQSILLSGADAGQ